MGAYKILTDEMETERSLTLHQPVKPLVNPDEAALRQVGSEWVKDGRDSRWEVPVYGSNKK